MTLLKDIRRSSVHLAILTQTTPGEPFQSRDLDVPGLTHSEMARALTSLVRQGYIEVIGKKYKANVYVQRG